MNLFTCTQGQGRDLILLHGWAMNGDVWEDIVPSLARHWRVTCVDLPGHGRSLDSPRDYSLANLATAVATVLPPTAVLVGWSLGGLVATQLALDLPRRIERLVLVASAPKFVRDASWPDGVEAEVLDGFGRGLKDDYQATINRFIAIQSLGSEHARRQQRCLRERVFRHGAPQPAALEGGLAILRHTDLRPRLPELACACRLITGALDSLFRRRAAERTRELIRNADLCVIDGAGHAPFLSHPEAFLAALTPFLTKNGLDHHA
jgi:pimeloyl-[acyl-carrier protein] methyl ester esterase